MFAYYLQLALRRCRKSPAMVALLVLTMAIGIASCMTAMTVFHALSGDPIPGISDHLYVVTMDARQARAKDDDASYDKPDSLLRLRDAKALVNAHHARQQIAVSLSMTRIGTPDGKHTALGYGLIGYGPLLTTLGVPFKYGRPWTAAEQQAHDPVVVIDARLAEKLFGEEDAVGRSVTMGRQQFRVIGVTVPWKTRMRFFQMSQNTTTLGHNLNFFVPVDAALEAGVGPFLAGECAGNSPVVSFQSVSVKQCRWLETWVALDTPAQVSAYGRFLAGYAQAQHDAGRFVYPPHARLYGTRAWMAINQVVPNDVDLNMILAGGFLLLCMVNVAGLLAARFLRRQVDTAIRRALGASRMHVFAQHVVESGLLGIAGGLAALPLTLLGLWIVRMQPVGYAAAAQFSGGVFAMLLGLSLLVGLLVGILPAWRVCRRPPALQIKVG